MTAKRILMACALAMIFGSTGCRSWCEYHHPCPTAAPACAAPCYQQPVSNAPPTWNGGGRGMSCQCVPN